MAGAVGAGRGVRPPSGGAAAPPPLAVLLDLYSRRVIGWAMSATPDKQVAVRALRMAVERRQPPPGLIHHTDQGALYTSVA
ncbi:MAG: DDE-type integrase/transposase/recombinase [Nitrospirae bacterium]|nr:MAG: DDE-type integrase/transposase/recombinase [Nitrospirota bacterium]